MSVLVFGDIMLDKYVDGLVHRISPEAPVPVVNVQNVYNAIGGCGNVAAGITAQGVATELFSLIGNNDQHGNELKDILKQHKISSKLFVHDLPTITKVRIVSNQHQLLRYDIEKIAEPAKKVVTQICKAIKNSSSTIAVISDYGKGMATHSLCQFLINQFTANKRKVLVDPKSADWTKYKGSFLISPNFKEFCDAIGHPIANNNEIIETYAQKLIQLYNIENILITRSANGMSLVNKKTAFHIPAIAKEVYDVTGAGDTVIATVAAMLCKGKSLKASILLANKAAAIAVGHFGTYCVSKKELFKK